MKPRWPWVLVVLVSLIAMVAAESVPAARPEAAGMSSQRLERIAQAIRAEIDQGRLPGAVIAIARKGKLIYHEAFGFLDKGAGIPMPKDAIFNIASMTKPMTAVGALSLYEEGRLLVNDPVGKYLPQLDKMPVVAMNTDVTGPTRLGSEPARRKPTLQDLMRHTAGLTYGNRGTTELHKMYEALNLDKLSGPEFLERLGKLPLHYQPGTVWDYSLGLDVLGLVIEAVTKQSLGRYLEERLLKPLSMVDTAFMVPPEKATRYAKALPLDPATGNPQRVPDRTKAAKMECGGGAPSRRRLITCVLRRCCSIAARSRARGSSDARRSST